MRAAAATAGSTVQFNNLGAGATINLAGPLTFTRTSATVWRHSGTTTSLTVGGNDIQAASHLYFYIAAGQELTLNSGFTFTSGPSLLLVSTGGTVTFNGDITGIAKLWVTSNSTAVVGTTTSPPGFDIADGTLRFATDGSYTSALEIEGTATIDTGAHNVTITGAVTDDGTNALVKAGSGTLTLRGANTASGTMRIDAGTLSVATDDNLSVGTLTLNGGNLAVTGATTIDNAIVLASNATIANAANVILPGAISGTGMLTKSGAGTLTLTGTNTYTGGTTISGGRLVVNGSIGAITLNGGTLGGSGSIGNLTANSGSTVAPGNSIGTVTVIGNTSLGSGTTYAVEVDNAGNSDLIAATGTVTIDSGATVTVSAENGTDTGSTYAPSTTYTILTADTGVTGTFGSVTDSFAFLDATLGYDANNVTLTLLRNDFTFASVANTANRRATGAALDILGSGNSIYDAVIVLGAAGARTAFDALSGEIHASASGMLLDDSRFVRDAASDRMLTAFDAGPDAGRAVWTSVYGAWSAHDGDGNASGYDRRSGGFFAGMDSDFSDRWRGGFVTGYGSTGFDGSASSGSADSFHLGAYAGGQGGAFSYRFGAAWALHQIDTTRSVSIGAFDETLSAGYNASTAQAFGEIGRAFSHGGTRFEPHAGFALVRHHSDGFGETGGSAALTAAAASETLGVATLGIRAETEITEAFGKTAKLHGGIAWRHAFGDVTPESSMRFAGGNAFTVSGAPASRDSIVIEAGAGVALSDNAALSLDFRGEIGGAVRDGTVRAGLSARF